ncbi:FAD-dependent oxidoreductase [Catenuloplanes sp. NPDC051500]|uniref:FAD-dependent oxidoreductase n=1 Tax=Catenuloplanes sp. NPDC051500 TaxID=3363959 RepID=UPI0037AA0040
MTGADVVIVGGGLAGLEVARHLTGRRVRVVEAGPDAGPVHVNAAGGPVSPLQTWLEPGLDPYFWRPWQTARPPHYAGVAGLRRRLGGRSLYWQGVTLPIESWALGDWPQEIVRDLTGSFRGGPSLYDRVLADLDSWRGGYTPAGPKKITIGGYEFCRTPRAIRPAGVGWEAYSALNAGFRPDASLGSAVEQVLTSGGRAVGVRLAGGDRISCDTVVLAAGTVENARLAAGLSVPASPYPIVDKITQGFTVAVPPSAPLPPGGAYVWRGNASLRTNVLLNVDAGPAAVVINVGAMGEQLVDPAGVVRPPVVHPALGPDDVSLVAQQRSLLREIWCDLAGLLALEPVDLTFPDFATAERTLEMVLPDMHGPVPPRTPVTWSRAIGTEYHEAGTLAFGHLLGNGHDLQGVRGVHVAGPAAFPRSGAANPSLTTLALARRLAAVLTD